MITIRTSSVNQLASACKQLWNWVGEQKDKALLDCAAMSDCKDRAYRQGNQTSYSNVRLYMRKFFSGLIDFEQE